MCVCKTGVFRKRSEDKGWVVPLTEPRLHLGERIAVQNVTADPRKWGSLLLCSTATTTTTTTTTSTLTLAEKQRVPRRPYRAMSSVGKKQRPSAQHPARISAGSPRVGPGGCKTKTCCQRGNGKMLLGSWREACVTRCVRATQRKRGKSSRWPADASLISDSYDNAGSLLSPSSKQQSKQELGLPSRRGFPKCLVWTWRPRPWQC